MTSLANQQQHLAALTDCKKARKLIKQEQVRLELLWWPVAEALYCFKHERAYLRADSKTWRAFVERYTDFTLRQCDRFVKAVELARLWQQEHAIPSELIRLLPPSILGVIAESKIHGRDAIADEITTRIERGESHLEICTWVKKTMRQTAGNQLPGNGIRPDTHP